MTEHFLILLLKIKDPTLALYFQIICALAVIYGSLTQDKMSLFIISFKAPTAKVNFRVGILKAVAFLQNPGDFKVGDITLQIRNQAQNYMLSR